MKTRLSKTIVTCLIGMLIAFGGLSRRCLAGDKGASSDGLVMHLSFDSIKEKGGKKFVIDDSGHDNHGVLLGGQIAEGRIGNALKCSAINKADGVRVKDNDSLDLDAVTMAAWIKTEQNDGQWNRILDKGWQTGYNLCIGGDYKGKSWYRTRAQLECANKPMTSKTPVVDNEWHFVVGTYDGKTLQIYIDGKLDIERGLKKPSEKKEKKEKKEKEKKDKWAEAAPMKHNETDITIGQLAVPEPEPHEDAFFDGLIDEVRLYNRVLSAEEVQKLYQVGAAK